MTWPGTGALRAWTRRRCSARSRSAASTWTDFAPAPAHRLLRPCREARPRLDPSPREVRVPARSGAGGGACSARRRHQGVHLRAECLMSTAIEPRLRPRAGIGPNAPSAVHVSCWRAALDSSLGAEVSRAHGRADRPPTRRAALGQPPVTVLHPSVVAVEAPRRGRGVTRCPGSRVPVRVLSPLDRRTPNRRSAGRTGRLPEARQARRRVAQRRRGRAQDGVASAPLCRGWVVLGS